jgi:hypothetical protein
MSGNVQQGWNCALTATADWAMVINQKPLNTNKNGQKLHSST